MAKQPNFCLTFEENILKKVLFCKVTNIRQLLRLDIRQSFTNISCESVSHKPKVLAIKGSHPVKKSAYICTLSKSP